MQVGSATGQNSSTYFIISFVETKKRRRAVTNARLNKFLNGTKRTSFQLVVLVDASTLDDDHNDDSTVFFDTFLYSALVIKRS